MRYAQIRDMDISNGEGIGVALFVQGCHFHCKNCFNNDTWDFEGGKEYTNETKDLILSLLEKPHIKRLSILGGEPLADENVEEVMNLISSVRTNYPDIVIWLWTGYTVEEIFTTDSPTWDCPNHYREIVIENVDYLIDGRYIDELRNLKLKFRGSENQRLLNNEEIREIIEECMNGNKNKEII